jgi:RNA polymerase sigma-70 factor (ECF subfamily)
VASETDESNWARALAGEGEAFGRIFDRHRARLHRHSAHLVPRAADVDDVVAIAFFEAWRRRQDARFVDESLLPWLLVIATNSARNVSRSSRRYRALLQKLPPSEHVIDQFAGSDDTAQRALAQLSVADQQVITLCVLDGLSELEAAEALGIAAGTVKSRLSRARARLARQLESAAAPDGTLSQEATNEA